MHGWISKEAIRCPVCFKPYVVRSLLIKHMYKFHPTADHNGFMAELNEVDRRMRLDNFVPPDADLEEEQEVDDDADYRMYFDNFLAMEANKGNGAGIIDNVEVFMKEESDLDPLCVNSDDDGTCPTCQKTFKTPTSLKSHIKSEHPSLVKYCCEIPFFTQEPYDKHTSLYHTEHWDQCGHNKYFEIHCKHCTYWSISLKSMESHYERKHLHSKRFTCEVCRAGFDLLGPFEKHRQTHEDKPMMKCDICDAPFKVLTAIEGHKKKFHTEHFDKLCNTGKLKCKHCDVTTSTKPDMLDHLDCSHGIVVPTTQKNDFRQFYCNTCCRYYRTRLLLKSHVSREHMFKPKNDRVCSICRITCGDNKLLLIHMRENHLFKYVCSYCKKRFAQLFTLSRHMREKHMPKIRENVKCRICDVQFAHMNELLRHIHVIHPDTDPSTICVDCNETIDGQQKEEGSTAVQEFRQTIKQEEVGSDDREEVAIKVKLKSKIIEQEEAYNAFQEATKISKQGNGEEGGRVVEVIKVKEEVPSEDENTDIPRFLIEIEEARLQRSADSVD
ncbi:zinc finger and BTB domain-containing protein 41-like [Anthonomus grandis grandis]|uniref:zinc finger and BTB domain-containing protein 41-like n=1 Tax=Anthonomus grandis grandis TaxID=2921223 RepID=UPI002165EB18|nr:zinc finger and BTB domain-containing protein 41-like [Anthonomus grandis grandis]